MTNNQANQADQAALDASMKATTESAILLLKAALGINGASGLAYFAFLGSIIAKGGYKGSAWITSAPLILFALGVSLAILAILFTLWANIYATHENVSINEGNTKKAGILSEEQASWRKHTIWMLYASLILFIFGILAIVILIFHLP